MRQLMLIFIFMVPAAAQAAGSWCLVLDERMNCRFMSSDACYAAAGSRGGNCMPNPTQAGVSGDKAWCVVTSTMRRCTYYYQQGPCVRAAQELNGGCVPNTDKLIKRSASNKSTFGYLINEKGDYDVTAANGCNGDLTCEAAISSAAGR